MKRLLLSAALTLSAMPTYAGNLALEGLDDAEVIAPARAASGDWTGPYVGLSYGRSTASNTSTSYSEQCFKFDDKAGQRFNDEPKDCATYVPPDGYSLERVQIPGDTVTTSTSSDDIGAFAGYRHDFGRVVGGIEVGVLGDTKSGELQIGLDLGQVLAYSLAGIADDGINSGAIYGAGVDLKLGKNLLLGVKHTTGDLGDMTTVRLGIQF